MAILSKWMNNSARRVFLCSLVLGILVIAIGIAYSAILIDLKVRRSSVHFIFSSPTTAHEILQAESFMVGDINGDRFADIIIRGREIATESSSTALPVIAIVFGKEKYSDEVYITEQSVDVLIRLRGALSAFYPDVPPAVGDISGDSINDLLIPVEDGLEILMGRKIWPAVFDLRKEQPDVRIAVGKAPASSDGWLGLATTGDLNNDGISDLIVSHTSITVENRSRAKNGDMSNSVEDVGFGFFGRKSWPKAVNVKNEGSDLTIAAAVGTKHKQRIRTVKIGDLNGDGYGDIVVGPWEGVLGKGGVISTVRDPWAIAWVVAGQDKIPRHISLSAGNPQNSSVSTVLDFRAHGYALEGGFEVGNITGDRTADIVVSMVKPASKTLSQRRKLCVVRGGSDFFSRKMTVPATDCSVIGGKRFEMIGPAGIHLPVIGDFNGDNWKDIFIGSPENVFYGILGKPTLKDIDVESAPDVKILPPTEASGFGFLSAIGDINGDGFSDFLTLQTLGTPGIFAVFGRER